MKKSKWNRGLMAVVLSLAMVFTSLQLPVATTEVYAGEEVVSLAPDAGTLEGGKTYQVPSGSEPFELTEQLVIPKDAEVTLDLNGMILDLKDDICGIIVNGKLTITDTNNAVVHRFKENSDVRMEYSYRDKEDIEVTKALYWVLDDSGDRQILGGYLRCPSLL